MDLSALLDAADELYALGPSEFVARRDTLASVAKATDPQTAALIKKLKRPTMAAWAVNLLVRRDADQIEQVFSLAVGLREAAETLDGGQLRELTSQRRHLTAALTTRARTFAAQAGNPVSGSVADQVEATLTAAVLDAGAAQAVRSGFLTGALQATGLEPTQVESLVALPQALGHLAPRVDDPVPEVGQRPKLRVVPDPDAGQRARRAAQHALAEAERAVVRVTGALQRAEREVAAAEADALRVQVEMEELRRRLVDLEDQAETIDGVLTAAEEVRDLVALDHHEALTTRDETKATLARS